MAILLSVVGYGVYVLVNIPVQKIPYSFLLPKTYVTSKDSQILIVGDRMAKRFSLFEKSINKTLSAKLKTPVKINTISGDGETIYRTLNKLKNLKTLPKVLIYIGGGQEDYEYLFKTKDIPIILENFSQIENEKIQTLLMFFPFASKFLFKPIENIILNPLPTYDSNKYDDSTFQARSEVHYKFYEYKLLELIEFARNNDILLIAITNPINYLLPPKKICELTSGESIDKDLSSIISLTKKGDYKEASKKMFFLKELASNNALVNYTNAIILKQQGNFSEAKKYFHLANAFDCYKSRPSTIYNTIIKNKAKENQIHIYDFDGYLEDKSMDSISFIDEIYPQPIYFEELAEAIGEKIRKILKI